MPGPVTKIYDLKTLGYDEVHKNLEQINKDFIAIKKTKLELASSAAAILAAQGEESEAYKKASQALQEATQKELELLAAKKQATNETKAAQIVRQEEINQRRAEKAAVNDAAGSYNALYKEYRHLYNLVKSTPTGQAIQFNGSTLQFDQAIAKLKQLAVAEQDFRRQFQRDGLLVGEYTSGIIQAFKKLGLGDLIGGQITKAQSRLKELNTSFEALKQELSEVKVSSQGSLEGIEQQLIANRKEAVALTAEVGRLQTEFRGSGDIGNQISSGLAAGFKNARQQLAQLVLGYVGFQAVFSGIIGGIETAKELSDQTTNLEVELGKAKGGAQGLVDQLAKLDTRTKLTVLEDIANIAAKAGVSEQSLVGVTQALDKIKIAFGKDFGDVETGTESLVKLINIFEGTDQVTGENLLHLGNSIRTLANESVASVPFINDFSKRMAGLKGIVDISLPSVLGLASGFEQFGQTAEVSSTALVRIIPKLASDTQKFADIAGITKQAFTDLLQTNPAEALIKVSQALVGNSQVSKITKEAFREIIKNGTDEAVIGVSGALEKGKASIVEISQAFADSNLGSGRIASVLGVLGKNADDFRKSINSAGESIKSTANIETAFNAKNDNLAATLDKVSKKFADAANSKAFQTTLLVIGTLIAFLASNITTILIPTIVIAIGFTNTWAGSVIRLTTAYALQAAAWIIEAGQLAVNNGLKAAATVITNVFAAATIRSAAASGAAAVAYRVLAGAIALITSPMGIVVGLIAVFTTLVGILGASAKGTAETFKQLALQQKLYAQAQQEGLKATSDQRAAAAALATVVKDLSISEDTRLAALQKLIAIDPVFKGVLDGQKISIEKLTKALDDYNTNLIKKAALEASAQIQQKEFAKLTQLQVVKQDIESAQAQNNAGKVLSREVFTDEINSRSSGAVGSTIIEQQRKVLKSALQNVEKEINDQKNRTQAAADSYKKFFADIQKEVESSSTLTGQKGKPILPVDIDIPALKAQLDALDKQLETFRGTNAEIIKLRKQRSDAQDALDRALGLQKSSAPQKDKLNATDANSFKDIEATRDLLLAQEKLKRTQDQEDEETYLTNILKINQDAIDKKLALLKGANNEERRVAAELQLDRITQEQETNKKLFDLREKVIKDEFDSAKKNAESTAAEITNNPSSDELQRAQAKLDADRTILAAQQVFNTKMDALEKDFALKSKKNAQDRADALRALAIALGNATIVVTKASLDKQLKDSEDSAVKSIDEIKATIAQKTVDILGNDKLTDRQKSAQLNKIEQQGTIDVLANEVAALRIQLPIYQDLLNKKFITQKQYSDKYLELKNKEAALIKNQSDAEATGIQQVVNALKDGVKSILLGIQQFKTQKEGIDAAVNDALSIVKDSIKQAEEAYFQNLTNKVDAEKDASLQILDVQKQQALDQAQTEGEKASIEKKFTLQSQKLEQEASEKKKQIALKKMAIDFGVAVIKTLAEYPFPFSLIPVAGLTLAYFLNRSAVQNQKFEKGGQLGDVPTTGGAFGGKPHSQGGTPFIFKGQQFEAEVNELAIVRTKNTPRDRLYQVAGTQAQIASAMNVVGGGRQFAPGAKMQRFDFGGHLGESLQPPVFTPTGNQVINQGRGISEEKFEQMVSEVKNLAAEQSARIDRLKVEQVTDTVTKAQNKIVKQRGIGAL